MAKARHSDLECDPGCSVEATVSLLEGKWKCVILYRLAHGTLRFNELRRAIPNVTQRMLINQLRELETDGLVHRLVHSQVPPRVDYSLTERGRSIVPVLAAMKEWGDRNMSVFDNRRQTQSSDGDNEAAPITASMAASA
jgi:DNA-binding HxlR family transcriptional regulator